MRPAKTKRACSQLPKKVFFFWFWGGGGETGEGFTPVILLLKELGLAVWWLINNIKVRHFLFKRDTKQDLVPNIVISIEHIYTIITCCLSTLTMNYHT